MPQPLNERLREHIARIETLRQSRVLVLAASNLDMEILPALYEQLSEIGKTERLDVLLHCRGGVVNAARRVALLLRQSCSHLGFIVPYHCESSATLLVLAGDEIIAGDLALFSPVDPQLQGGSGDAAFSALSCMDIKQFGTMSEAWFGVASDEARAESLALLCNSIFPPTLTAFYRTTLEMQAIGEQLLAYQFPASEPAFRARIVEQLMFGYHSHNYAIDRGELAQLGLRIRAQSDVESVAWELSKVIQTVVGGGLRSAPNAPWHDVLLASRDGARLRLHQDNGMLPEWQLEPRSA